MPEERILCVDDEPSCRKLYQEILENEGYVVKLASSGEEAIEILEGNNFDYDMLITDIYMDEISGIDLTEKALQNKPGMIIIVMTGHKTEDVVLKCFELGAYDFLQKPFEIHALTRMVKNAFERKERLNPDNTMNISSEVRGWVELTATSDYEYVERFRKFSTLLTDTNLKESTIEDIKVAIDELGRNAVEWGNKEDKSKEIKLSYCIFDDKIVFKIEDEGEGFNPRSVDDPTIDPLGHIQRRAEQGKRVGGYGLFIVNKLMDNVIYNDKGNVVLLTKYFNETEEDAEESSETESE